MLNGLAPILIFYFPIVPKSFTFNALSGIPVIGGQDVTLNLIGIPIPIYLDERVTGVYIESETKSLEIDTTVDARADGSDARFSQRGLDNSVTVNLLANKDSILLSALLALNDIIFNKVVSREYSVSYLNGTTLIFNGLLHSFNTSVGTNDDLIRISMQLMKTHTKPTPSLAFSETPKITGTTP